MKHCIPFLALTLVSGIALSTAVPRPETSAFSISPSSISLDGIVGTRVDQPVTIYNPSGSALTVTLSESTVTSTPDVGPSPPIRIDFQPFIEKIRPQRPALPLDARTVAPLVFSTAATDSRGDNLLVGVDILELQYQKRTTILGVVLDLRVTMVNSDSNLAGFIHLDTDQDFGTGVWPTPWGFGPRGRDIGAEFEVLVDASGIIADSLGLGSNPIAIILRAADTTIVPFPLGLSVVRDSLLTITVTGIPFGPLGINDPDQNLNVGAVFARLDITSAIPDFVPNTGHGTIGSDTGVSWIRQSQSGVTIPAGDSASVIVSVLAARPSGHHEALLKFNATGNPTVLMPIQMDVIGLNAIIHLSATSFRDTVMPGESTSLDITLSNSGNTELVWAIADTAGTPWLSTSPAFGIVNPGATGQATITMNSTGLNPGNVYSSHLLIASNDLSNGTILFPVFLHVATSSSARDQEPVVPHILKLYQNFPNPFNPSTSISFDLPQAGPVSLKVLDILGREVSTVVRQPLTAGFYAFRFDAENLASGMYFYRLETPGISVTRSMLLLR